MSTVTRVRAELALASAGPWDALTTIDPTRVEIGRINKDHDGYLVQELRNSTVKFLALYDAVKAYEVRLIQKRAPLSAQRTALINALAALDA